MIRSAEGKVRARFLRGKPRFWTPGTMDRSLLQLEARTINSMKVRVNGSTSTSTTIDRVSLGCALKGARTPIGPFVATGSIAALCPSKLLDAGRRTFTHEPNYPCDAFRPEYAINHYPSRLDESLWGGRALYTEHPLCV